MATHPQIIAEIDQLIEHSRQSNGRGAAGVNRVLSMAKARIEKQDELIMDVLTVRDHYAMAALTGLCAREENQHTPVPRNRLTEAFTIADLMLELRRG